MHPATVCAAKITGRGEVSGLNTAQSKVTFARRRFGFWSIVTQDLE